MVIRQLKQITKTSNTDYIAFVCDDGLNIQSSLLTEPPAPSPKLFSQKLRTSEKKY